MLPILLLKRPFCHKKRLTIPELTSCNYYLVREGRLELPWVTPLDPKSSASTSSATLALCQVFSVYGSDGKFTLQTSPLQVKDRDDGEGSMTSTIRMASAFGVREFWNTGQARELFALIERHEFHTLGISTHYRYIRHRHPDQGTLIAD